MPPKRASIGRLTRAARKKKQLRASQTSEERKASNEADRLRVAQSRASESEEQRAARNLANRLRATRSRALEAKGPQTIKVEIELEENENITELQEAL